MNNKILVVDDEENIGELLRLYLEKESYHVLIAYDGRTALELFREHAPSLVLLDVMLPVIDGWQVCREIRKISLAPIIMLTAKNEVFDKVLGFDIGADDYISKPFESKELVARVKAVLRRSDPNNPDQELREVAFDNLNINLNNYELRVSGKKIDAPPKEMELLFFMASHPNHVFTRNQLLDEVWGFDYYGDSRTIDVHIKRLREKLDDISGRWTLQTVWSVGYKFATEDKPCE